MKNALPHITGLLIVVLLLAGCKTTAVSRRINENPTLFASLDPEQKAYVSDGIVFPGDNVEIAYLALGEPDTVETKERDDIAVTMWTYHKYYPAGELADFLNQYSRSRNSTLLRETNLAIGAVNVDDHVDRRAQIPNVRGNSTHTDSGMTGSLHLADIPVYKLYVLYYLGKITDVMIESLDGTVFTWKEDAIALEKARELKKAKT